MSAKKIKLYYKAKFCKRNTMDWQAGVLERVDLRDISDPTEREEYVNNMVTFDTADTATVRFSASNNLADAMDRAIELLNDALKYF